MDNAFKSWTARWCARPITCQLASKGPGRVRAQREVRHRAAARRGPEPERRAGAQGRPCSKAVRNDIGHFNGASEAARHGGQRREVDATCSAATAARTASLLRSIRRRPGVPRRRTGSSARPATTRPSIPVTVVDVPSVKFPSGRRARRAGPRQRVREPATAAANRRRPVDAQIATGKYKFLNVALPAGGSDEAGLGRSTSATSTTARRTPGPLAHTGGTQCTSCHDPPAATTPSRSRRLGRPLQVTATPTRTGDPKNIRLVHRRLRRRRQHSESLSAEIDGLAAKLLAAMQAAAALCYDGNTTRTSSRTRTATSSARRRAGVEQRLHRVHAGADEGVVQLPALRARSPARGPTTSTTWRSSSTTASPTWAGNTTTLTRPSR
jgi:hypothetical protein